MVQRQAFDAACGASSPTTATTQSSITTDSTASQDQCANALSTLSSNAANCTLTSDEPRIICFGACRDIYDRILRSCPPDVSFVVTVKCCNTSS